MKLLLDSHAFIWFINGDRQLPKNIIERIRNLDNRCYLSIASIWEIAIKSSLKKLALKSDFNNIATFASHNDIDILPLNFDHLQKLLELKYHHRDPFDRIIIAQSLVEGLTIVTKDDDFKLYRVKTVWN